MTASLYFQVAKLFSATGTTKIKEKVALLKPYYQQHLQKLLQYLKKIIS